MRMLNQFQFKKIVLDLVFTFSLENEKKSPEVNQKIYSQRKGSDSSRSFRCERPRGINK